jgi:2-keto-4-pentenoate hydratase
MKEDVNVAKAPFAIHNVDELFDGLLPSIEVVDFRFNKELKNIGIYNLISSNGASEHWIYGENIYPINKINLENHVVSIYVDSLLIDKGNTNKVLENPLNSAIWLINQLALKGEPLLKGQFISTGTCTKAIQIKPGNTIKADFGSIGSVKLNYV